MNTPTHIRHIESKRRRERDVNNSKIQTFVESCFPDNWLELCKETEERNLMCMEDYRQKGKRSKDPLKVKKKCVRIDNEKYKWTTINGQCFYMKRNSDFIPKQAYTKKYNNML